MSAGVLKILVNSNAKMSRGKYAAHAVHAALSAAGIHPGCAVIVLGGTPAEIEECSVRVRDAGRTELPAGTLTAGVVEMPEGWPLECHDEDVNLPSLGREVGRFRLVPIDESKEDW